MHLSLSLYIYIYIYVYTYVYIYIYISDAMLRDTALYDMQCLDLILFETHYR